MFNGPWLPAGISANAAAYDAQFTWTLIAAGIIFALAQIALLTVAWRFRATQAKTTAPQTAPSGRLETAWTLATAVLFLGLLALGGRVWATVQFTPAPADAETIEVLGKQFAWSFRYAGPDGRFGRTDVRLINDAGGNPFGVDPSDAAGKDDVVSASLRVPAGRPVKLMLNSVDVIHSFFVRELRLKQDLVPGMRIPLSFTATVPGTYEIPCAELCGLGHAQMRSTLVVLPSAEYTRWKQGQSQ